MTTTEEIIKRLGIEPKAIVVLQNYDTLHVAAIGGRVEKWVTSPSLKAEMVKPLHCGDMLYTIPDINRIVQEVRAQYEERIAELENKVGGNESKVWSITDDDGNFKWARIHTIDEMQQFYLSRLDSIRAAARENGYAIGLHGSTRRDFDLMAMQWREDCSDIDTLAKAIQFSACGYSNEIVVWENKPIGRVATSLPICWTPHDGDFKDKPSVGMIDLSVFTFPALESERKKAKREALLEAAEWFSGKKFYGQMGGYTVMRDAEDELRRMADEIGE